MNAMHIQKNSAVKATWAAYWLRAALVVCMAGLGRGWAQDVAPEATPAPAESAAPAEADAAQEPQPAAADEQEAAPAATEEPAPEEEPAPAPAPKKTTPTRVAPRPGRQPLVVPTQIGTPASPNRPKGGMVPGEPVSFDFSNAKLINVIEQVGMMTGKTFEVDPGVAETPVTVISQQEISPDMAYYVLETILATKQMKLVPTLDGKWIKVLPVADAKEKQPLVIGSDKAPTGYDAFSTYVVPVKYADVTEVSNLLKNIGSTNARCDAYANTNTLILSDTADGLRNMLEVLKEIDVPGYDTEMEIFNLDYTRAEVLQTQIQDVLMGAEGGAPRQPGAPTPPRPVPVTRGRAAIPGQAQSTVVGSREETLRIVADERLNALIVVATKSLMERVRDLIEKLDKPTFYESNNMHVYELLNANAEDVENALNAIVGGSGSSRSRSSRSSRSTGTSGASSAARSASMPSQGGGMGGAGEVGGEVQPFEKQVSISRYDQTNALLIVAAPQDYKRIKDLIAQLDVPQRQVNVEAIIMEVTISDSFELTVEATALTGNDGFALNNVINLANILTGGPLAAAGSGLTGGVIQGTTKVPISVGGVTTLQEIPNVPLLLKAVEKLTTVNVLSQPTVTTVDNEEAKLTIGQEVPTPAAINSSESNLLLTQSRIERKDVGVKLTVKPQINEGDYVSMETEVEVSKPITSEIGIDPNQTGPTFQKSQIKNTMIIKDGYTGIMGGLLSESIDRSVSQPPVLGDIPLLGWFLKSRSSKRDKRNLVVVMTPHIIKEGRDYERVTRSNLDEFNSGNVDVVFEQGVIRKIKRKIDMRKNYHPVVDRAQALTGDLDESHKDMQR